MDYARNPSWTHGGGVVWRGGADEAEILLVRARRAPHDWVLPKGHLEPGETPDECARREVREEAGVEAEPVAFVGEDAFTRLDGTRVHTAFFLMRFIMDAPADEDREVRWCPVPEALALLRFDGTRSIIREARRAITDSPAPPPP